MSPAQFRTAFPEPGTVIHLKGFSGPLAGNYDDAILAKLAHCRVLAWDGDNNDSGGFTRIIHKFLDRYPNTTAVGFKKRFEIPKFNSQWYTAMARFPGRIKVCAIDYPEDGDRHGVVAEVKKYSHELPKWAMEYFVLGRTALKITQSRRVVAMGGGGIAASEASAGFGDGVQWTVYALSRGKKEQFPSLCDFALTHRHHELVELVRGKSPDESDAFYGDT